MYFVASPAEQFYVFLRNFVLHWNNFVYFYTFLFKTETILCIYAQFCLQLEQFCVFLHNFVQLRIILCIFTQLCSILG
jgi:hypothetical protein